MSVKELNQHGNVGERPLRVHCKGGGCMTAKDVQDKLIADQIFSSIWQERRCEHGNRRGQRA